MFAMSLTFILAACNQQSAPESAITHAPDQPVQPVAPKSAEQLFSEKLDAVLKGEWRSVENKARDQYRHPKETLAFFGIKPGMNVIEITPGGGWYTEILAPLLKDNGQYAAAIFSDLNASDYIKKSNEKLRAKLAADTERFSAVKTVEMDEKTPNLGGAATADVVLTFRNVHNWVEADTASAMFKAFFDALKPGGVLGVVDHRAAPDTDLEKIKQSGYIPEALVIQLAEAAGFKLEAKSEINANPKDTKDYEKGVWTLPPTLALGDKDKDKYLAIGESDRMTLKFIKPKTDQLFKAPDDHVEETK